MWIQTIGALKLPLVPFISKFSLQSLKWTRIKHFNLKFFHSLVLSDSHARIIIHSSYNCGSTVGPECAGTTSPPLHTDMLVRRHGDWKQLLFVT